MLSARICIFNLRASFFDAQAILCVIKRCHPKNRGFPRFFSFYLRFPRFFKNQLFVQIKRCQTPFSPTSGERLVGGAAKRQIATNSGRTISSIKRYMGSDYRAHIDGKDLAPQEISAMILAKIRRPTLSN